MCIDERREYKRVFFTLEDNVTSVIQLKDQDGDLIQVTLLSISRGGVSFVGSRAKTQGLKEGDKITLRDIKAPEPLGTIDSVESEIKYILDFDNDIRIGFGCEFTDIPQWLLARITKYVDDRLEKMGIED